MNPHLPQSYVSTFDVTYLKTQLSIISTMDDEPARLVLKSSPSEAAVKEFEEFATVTMKRLSSSELSRDVSKFSMHELAGRN